jgi:uncharacterized protein (TIGR03083 family)
VNSSASGEAAGLVVFQALRTSHERLASALEHFDDDHVGDPSYDDDWTVAQVASHLGSGAEIFSLLLDAGLRHQPAPGAEQFQVVWQRWNTQSDAQQCQDALRSDASFLDRLSRLTSDEWAHWRLDFLGAEQTLTELLRLRLGEHAVHTWDIAVVLDTAASLPLGATTLILDDLPRLVERVGKGTREPVTVHVVTRQPDREFVLQVATDTARLMPDTSSSATTASLRLPSEAFVRLIYGRLDPDHTAPGSVQADGVALDTLRDAFPGF